MKKFFIATIISISSILCIGCTANFKTEPTTNYSDLNSSSVTVQTTTAAKSSVTIITTSTSETSTEIVEIVETTETTEVVTTVETTSSTIESSYVEMETTPIVTTVTTTEVSTNVDAPYTVRSGDTIGEIAYANYLTPEQVMAYNGLTTDIIQPGQIIYLPGVSEYEIVYPDIYSNSSGDNNSEYNPTPEYNSDGLVNWFSVTLSTSGAGYESWYNIELAASILDGYVLPAGTSFSWASVMGPNDTYQGYLLAPGYAANGEVVYVPGGGVCFVSTTLMQAARGAGCYITEKHDHSLPVSYATPGNEASVNWGSWDLRFYNPSSTTDLVFYVTTDEWSRSCTITCSPLS